MNKKKVVQFKARIKKFGSKGEKTGWTYIDIDSSAAEKLSPGNKKSFRVKGMLDNYVIKQVALIPMGDGNFILPLNAAIRKGTGKNAGGELSVVLEPDERPLVLNKEMMQCIKDDPDAAGYFRQLPGSHQNYFSKWVDSAKTAETKAKRIARILNALSRKMNFAEMLRAEK
jgi:hypothetical protein